MKRIQSCHSALSCIFLFLIAPCFMSADTTVPEKKPDSAGTSSTALTQPAAAMTRPWHVSVDSVSSDQLSLDVTALYPSASDKTTTIPGAVCATQEITCKKLHLIVQDSVVKDQLKQ